MRNLTIKTFKSASQMVAWFVPVFALIFSVGTVVFALVTRPWSEGSNSPPVLIYALFGAAAFSCLMIAAAVVVVRRYRLYGRSTLEVDRYPDDQSDLFCGKIVAAHALHNQEKFLLKLSEERWTPAGVGSGPDRGMTQTVWTQQDELGFDKLVVQGGRCLIPVEFHVPEPQSSPNAQEKVVTHWTLEVRATGPLPPYLAYFTLSERGSGFLQPLWS